MGIFSKKNDENAFFEMLESISENNEIQKEENAPTPGHILTAEEVLSEKKADRKDGEGVNPLEALKSRMKASSEPEVKKEEPEKTLLEKVKVYTTDEKGKDHSISREPIYKLESVADILKSESESFIDTLSKKYDLSVEDLSKPAEKQEKKEEIFDKTETFDDLLKYNVPEEEPVFVSEVQTSLPDISDIDNFVSDKPEETDDLFADGSTIKFVPVKEPDEVTHITVSSTTKPLDITKELEELPEEPNPIKTVSLEKTEFDDFAPSYEITNEADIKSALHKYSLRKRSAFISSFFSFLSMLILLFFFIPPLSDILIRDAASGMLVCGILLLISTLANIGIFKSVTSFFKKTADADALAMFSSLSALALSVSAYIQNESAFEIVLLASVVLFLRSLGRFWHISATLGNLRQLAKSSAKNAVTLISDPSVTFAMAKNSIEGDVLVAASRKTDFIEDFMKYSKYGLFLNGKIRIIVIASLIAAIVTGFLSANLYGNSFSGFYAAACLLLIASVPSIFFIDSLPEFCAAKRLNKTGSYLAGKTAAQKLELANAVVLSAFDIFPAGTVTLHDMKILSQNNVDDTLMRAASLTKAINSPLYPIFEEIADTNTSYELPDSDSIKYEERLGISGWVDNKLLFIGNRTLMEAHGIEVLDLELDRQILRRGYFPVYVASENKACALLIIQYNVDPEVGYELKKITKLGVTLLINNCDPNISEQMVCDYLGLYNDSVKVMSNAGVHMYSTAINETESCSAPAMFKGDGINFITLMNSASNVKKSNAVLTVLYTLFACFGVVFFIYDLFTKNVGLPSGFALFLAEIGLTLVSYLLFLFKKP